jgi:hypothetical protein
MYLPYLCRLSFFSFPGPVLLGGIIPIQAPPTVILGPAATQPQPQPQPVPITGGFQIEVS